VFSAGGDPDGPADGPPVGVPGSEGTGESPGSVPPASSQEPEPNATETNFFTAGCRVDADCGATRRCEFFPPESVASDAGLSDAGAPDAAPSEPLGTRGRCVARVAQ